MPSKTKRQAINRSDEDKAQSERFRETARELGAHENVDKFDEAFSKIVTPKQPHKP